MDKQLKTVVILQSNYIPWKGYFDLINIADEFILFDEVQYTRGDWRNRNKIMTANGEQWLTIPVLQKGNYHQSISQTLISDQKWRKKHWRAISYAYSKYPYWGLYKDQLEELYLSSQEDSLTKINYQFICAICEMLKIKTKIKYSHDFTGSGEKNDRLLDICVQADADLYLSGPAAKSYLNEDLFNQEDINVKWMNYDNYPVYTSYKGEFSHYLSVLDLLFNLGPNAYKYMLSFNDDFKL